MVDRQHFNWDSARSVFERNSETASRCTPDSNRILPPPFRGGGSLAAEIPGQPPIAESKAWLSWT
jgi:hypothetical protein